MLKFYRNKTVVESILKAMCVGMDYLEDNWKKGISKTNKNGIYGAVWAKRSDILEREFKDSSDINVLHIPRGGLWQIDPVLDLKTGTLYLLFNSARLDSIRNKYLKEGTSTHYAYSLLYKNRKFSPKDGEQLELIPFSEQEEQVNLKIRDIEKMLKGNSDIVNQVIMVSVGYYNGEAIEASLRRYTEKFELSDSLDVTDLIPDGMSILTKVVNENSTENIENNESEVEKPLVRLKKNIITNESR